MAKLKRDSKGRFVSSKPKDFIGKVVFPMTTSYLHHWEFWHALREILQNALDAELMSSINAMELNVTPQSIQVKTKNMSLNRNTLLLGVSTKRNSSNTIGQFGEGYKLAALVLARLGFVLTVYTGDEIWQAGIEYSDDYGEHVLAFNFYRRERENSKHLIFDISPLEAEVIPESLVHKVARWFRPELAGKNCILEKPRDKGWVFLNGLYLTHNEKLSHGYSFTPDRLKLDRDRVMVNEFDLVWETSKLWENRMDDAPEEILEAIESKKLDVAHISNHHYAYANNTKTRKLAEAYTAKYPDAVPVSSQEDINELPAGTKFQLVPSFIRTACKAIYNYVCKPRVPLATRLMDWLVDNSNVLSDNAKKQLKDIIRDVEAIENKGA